MGVLSIEELKWQIHDDMDEYDKKQLSLEKKIHKTKQKDSSNTSVAFDLIITGVCKEFNYTYYG